MRPGELSARFVWEPSGECFTCERSGVPVTHTGVLEDSHGALELFACLPCIFRLEYQAHTRRQGEAQRPVRRPLSLPPPSRVGVQGPVRQYA